MLKTTRELILTAGPTISHKEIEFATDAIIHGWNLHHSDYIKRFETVFAEYIGVKYALATSSCTGALHLALLAMGIGPGDEVIVPETTWIATASVVKYVGATPVFTDIDPKSWVMDVTQVEKHITKKTKVIIPVHLYGNVVDMDPLLKLAEKHNISILEDAAPSIGAIYKGKKTGSMGRAAAYSFQGAKALVTGEGGMFVTNDRDLFERVKTLGDHGRDPDRPLCSIETGYKYKMSNVQAALGLAQTERAEEIVAQKRKIFGWYSERLSGIEGITLNEEKPDTRNIFWMSSIVIDKKISISRPDLMKKLKERNVDSRPFFYPISSFPMYKSAAEQNPVAYDVPLRAINLPSGHERTEEEIDYICAHIRDILGAKSSPKINQAQPSGWLSYRDMADGIVYDMKNLSAEDAEKKSLVLKDAGKTAGRLLPLVQSDVENKPVVELLAKWRDKIQNWFPAQFKVTFEGTKKWLEKGVIAVKDRILFLVQDEKNKSMGHVGLFRFNYMEKSCEIDNIVRGEDGEFKGAMYLACKALIDWAFNVLGMEMTYLRVVSDNARAIALYEKLGYREIQRVPLMKITEPGGTRWIEVIGSPYMDIKRYFVTMKLLKSDWVKKNG